MVLLDLIYGKYKTVSIVGLAKNTGKTVALNHIIQEAAGRDMVLGLISTGRDGEAIDLITEKEKPQIYVEAGSIIATTSLLLPLAEATIEIIKATEHRTPLGEVVIGRVIDGGYVQIGGPQTAAGIREVVNTILGLGADLVLIDGAMDRRASAAPSISQATILSTGAVLSRDMDRVIEETLHMVNLFSLPAIEDYREREIIKRAFMKGQVAIMDKGLNIAPIPIKTALNSGQIIGDHIKGDSKYILIPGSLATNTVEGIINCGKEYRNIELVIADGTKIFIPCQEWLKFMQQAVKVKVLNPINIVAITINPYSPEGYYFDPKEFLDKTRYYIEDIPVVDLMLGGE